MLKTLQSLRASRSIKAFSVLDFKQGKGFYYLKVEAVLVDNNTLHIREYVSRDERIYSYHWQDEQNNLICR